MGVFNTVRSGLNVLFTPVLYGVVASLAIQLATWEKGDRTQDKMQDDGLNFKDKFDFIIVGGGSAGCVVANRLSEYYSVLVLEAGGEPNPLLYVPGLASHLMNRPEVDWMHKTTAQRRGAKLAQFKRASWAQGRGMGGSGNLDWMIGLRGNPRDFENWKNLVGDEDWGYKKILKYFQRHENFVGNTTDPAAHATGGELTIQLPDYRALAAEFVWAAKELGYPNLDLNGRFTEGFDELFYPSKRGEKLTTYKAFLEPIKRRERLTIRKYAVVTKLLLNKDNSVYGVEYERHSKKYTVYSSHEVILSAGTVQSPKLLLLSGIGPKRHLEDVGIKPQVNLPVGRNLQDHCGIPLGPFFIKDPLSFNFDRDITAKSFFEYGTFGQGPVTTTGYTATGFFASSFAKLRGETDWPDLQLLMHAVSVHSTYGQDISFAYGLQEELIKKYYQHAVGRHSFHIVVSLARPYARGEVRLASRDPTSPVIINPKYLEDPWEFDIKTLVEGVKKAVELVESTKKFKGIEGQFTNQVLPGCESVEFKSDAYWECYIRQFTVSLNNPVGTCSMGPRGSPHAVVDADLKVIGVKNLRVIDASVMPSIVVGGTSQATIAIAEKGSESILKYWKEGKDKLISQGSSSNLNIVKEKPPPPPTTTPRPLIELPTVTTKPFTFNWLQPQAESKANPWQEAMDSIASFSRTIQQSLKVPNQPILGTSTPIIPSTTTVRVESTSRAPKVQVQNSMFNIPQKYSTSAPLIPVPTHTTYRKIPVKVTSSSTPSYPAPTTFRPEFNTSSFSFPIIKSTYRPYTQESTRNPVRVELYNSAKVKTKNIIQDMIRKEQGFQIQKPVYILPPTSTTSNPTTTLRVTTRRPRFEVIQKEIRPFKNIEIPMTSVSYYVADSSTSTAPTTTSTVATPPLIIPAISLPNPLETETTTTRITGPRYKVGQSHLQSQEMFLAGLEPFRFVDVKQATEIPQPTSTRTSTEDQLYYLVRKKNKQNYEGAVKPQHSRRQRVRRPGMRQKPLLRKPQGRRPQSQRNYPLIQLPNRQNVRNLHQRYNQHPILHLLGDQQSVASAQSSQTSLDGIIQPAISSPLYQQNVLNQLIPIQK